MENPLKIITNEGPESRDLDLHQLKDLIKTYLEQLGVPFVPDASNEVFTRACCESMVARGWSSETISALQPHLPAGVVMACTAYSHLSSVDTRVFIALYTALHTHLDDVSAEHLEELRSFSSVHCQKGNHTYGVLNALSQILHALPQHINRDAANLILTSSLNFITSLLLESEIPQIPMPKHSTDTKFTRYFRGIGGVAEPYALFAFSAEIPWVSYIQALPNMVAVINYGNDVLSFFKEELSGEQTNVISLTATIRDVPKLQIAQELKDEAVASDKLVFDLISPDKTVQDSYKAFRAGYVAFHTSLARYRLHELF